MRRYAPLKASAGTTISHAMRLRVLQRDARAVGGCVGFALLNGACAGGLELDHVRASHGVGLKSVTCDCNLASLCGAHHRFKTEHGREVRPVLLAYLGRFGYSVHSEGHLDGDCGHVDPVFGCTACETRRVPA